MRYWIFVFIFDFIVLRTCRCRGCGRVRVINQDNGDHVPFRHFLY